MADTTAGRRAAATYSVLNVFPLLAFPLIVYALVTLTNGGSGWLESIAMQTTLISKDVWTVTSGDIFVGLSLFLLFVEVIKSTQTGASSIINHSLSVGLVLLTLLMFVTMQGYGTSEFFFLALMQILDVVAGFTITIAGARRDFGAGIGPGGPH